LWHNAWKLIIITLHIPEVSNLNCGICHPLHIIVVTVQRRDGDCETRTRLTLAR
jgi:hypothetical protein